jgi:hypothetical protein
MLASIECGNIFSCSPTSGSCLWGLSAKTFSVISPAFVVRILHVKFFLDLISCFELLVLRVICVDVRMMGIGVHEYEHNPCVHMGILALMKILTWSESRFFLTNFLYTSSMPRISLRSEENASCDTCVHPRLGSQETHITKEKHTMLSIMLNAYYPRNWLFNSNIIGCPCLQNADLHTARYKTLHCYASQTLVHNTSQLRLRNLGTTTPQKPCYYYASETLLLLRLRNLATTTPQKPCYYYASETLLLLRLRNLATTTPQKPCYYYALHITISCTKIKKERDKILFYT